MNAYLWFKALHLIFMVAWFAGLFYIFRLFVYHVKFKDQKNMAEAYTLMEKKLLYMIMHPAMTLTLVFGIGMLTLNPSLLQQGWIHAKLFCVALLIGYQVFAGITHKKFKRGNYFLSEKACRIINEVPTLLLIAIVFLAIFRPF
jgi:putative membrane protein